MTTDSALEEFVVETIEMLERITVVLTDAEKAEVTDDAINDLYREMHSIKGSAQLFGCQQIGQITHTLETSLSPVREKIIELCPKLVDVIFEGTDLVRDLCQSISNTGKEHDISDKLKELIPRIIDITFNSLNITQYQLVAGIGSYDTEELLRLVDVKKEPPSTAISESIPAAKKKEEIPQSSSPANKVTDSAESKKPASAKDINTIPIRSKKPKVKLNNQKSIAKKEKPMAETKPKATANAPKETIRVSVDLLDSLMNIVGEIVLIRNQFIQYGEKLEHAEQFNKLSQSLNMITSELQNEVMKTRMQPVGSILTKFHRIVRDVSKDLSKDIELVIEGAETELDKTLIEAVKDPLTHIVRNSADHGVETPEIRIANGKPSKGTITIRSYHEGGHVVIEVSDNGKGLSKEFIANKAIEKGVVTESDIEKMDEQKIFNLIFAPGFSTAEKVSSLSGRGVGMDVVRTNIEKIGGMVDLSSIKGEGTTVRLVIPLTLAIVPALIIRSGGHRFAVPQVKLVELVRIEENEEEQIEFLQGQPVYKLRGRILPLVYLNKSFELQEDEEKNNEHDDKEDNGTNIVVLHSEAGNFGLIVDRIDDSVDIVIKPLVGFLKSLGIYSGSTVLGDGSVTLTLDIEGLAKRTNIVGVQEQSDSDDIQMGIDTDLSEYLLVGLETESQFAIPLCIVSRLEEFKMKDVQRSGDINVISYRNNILTLVDVNKELGFKSSLEDKDPNSLIPVIVIEKTNRSFGFVVNEIKDIKELDNSNINGNIKDRNGILGSTILEEKIITLLDAFSIIPQPESSVEKITHNAIKSSTTGQGSQSLGNVLLAEDNNFFRKQIMETLTKAGYTVSAEINGALALDRLLSSAPGEFDLVLSDIEMPEMNGFELARSIRASGKFDTIPMVALTTRFRKKDLETGYEAGFNSYLEKLNGEELINTLDDILHHEKKGQLREA